VVAIESDCSRHATRVTLAMAYGRSTMREAQ
jgi:hypothetical protein